MRYFSLIQFFFILWLFITPFYSSGRYLSHDTLSTHHKTKESPLQSEVIYHASDSIRLDASERIVYLYRDASVKYQDMELKAGYIEIIIDSNIAIAHGIHDSGKEVELPEFHEGNDVYYAHVIRYNFKSHKGRINQVYTKEGEGYIHGKVVKKDTNNVYYIKNGNYTTCNKVDDPHFYIGATKLKVIPNDQVVTGPAWMVIEGVPTPLAIPFGFFPLESGQHSGILIPAYGESQQLGFFLQNGGYYLGLGQHADNQLRGDIYSYGSWALKDIFNYNDRYHYQGTFNIDYSLTKFPILGSEYSDQRNFFINWQDKQDPKARPNSTFSASVNAGSSNYLTYNSYTPTTFLQNTLQSNISFSQNFPETPFHLSLNAEHSQNTINHIVSVTLPELTFTADRLYPAKWFEENPELNNNKWYNNVSFTFSTNAVNRVTEPDSLLFKPKTLKAMQNAINNSVPLSGNFKMFKYFTLSPAITYSNIVYFQTTRENLVNDTLKIDTVQGVKTVNTYNASATLTTSVYGRYSLGSSNNIQFRQVWFPSIGMSYHPDYSASSYGYYQRVQNPVEGGQPLLYSIFQQGLYGGPGAGKAGDINLSLGTNLEMKVKQHTDSGVVYKKITLLERVTIGTSYNLAADSFKWADISITANTTLFKKLGVNYSSTLDPYISNGEGYDENELTWDNGKGLGRITSSDIAFTTTLTGGNKSQQNQGKTSSSTGSGLQVTSPEEYLTYEYNHPEFYAPIELNTWSASIFYNIVYSHSPGSPSSTTQSFTLNTSAQVTKYWYASLYTGYDFVMHQFTPTSISAKRDMHCWEFVFNTIPFGFHQSFSVEIHVKASVLQDLKIKRQRDWYDTQQYGE